MSGVLKLGSVTLGTENSGKIDLTNVGTASADGVTATNVNATNLTGTVTNLSSSLTALDTTASNGATANLDNTTLPLFGCRAFVNFDGTTYTSVSGVNHCTIRASGNVSMVVRTGQGTYTITFTIAMPDANYAASISGEVNNSNSDIRRNARVFNYTAQSISCVTGFNGNSDSKEDYTHVTIAIFR